MRIKNKGYGFVAYHLPILLDRAKLSNFRELSCLLTFKKEEYKSLVGRLR